MAIINGSNPEVWADALMESLKENLQMNSFQQGLQHKRAAKRKKKPSNHSSLVGSHGTRSMPLSDEHDSSTLRRWSRWSQGLEDHPEYHPELQVGLTLICQPALAEAEDITATQVALLHSQHQAQGAAIAAKIDEAVMEKIYGEQIAKMCKKYDKSKS